jgi:hypothetical protein
LWAAGIVAATVGLATAIGTWGNLRTGQTRLRRLAGDLRAMNAVGRRLDASLAALDAFERLPQESPAPLPELLAGVLPGHKPEERPQKRAEAIPGWAVNQREIRLTDVALDRALEFARRAEAQRPPWRVVRVAVRASSRQGGTGDAEFQFEALEKTGASPPR